MFTCVKAQKHLNVTEINEQVWTIRKQTQIENRETREGMSRDSESGREKQRRSGRWRRRKKPSQRGKLIAGCRLLADCAAAEAVVVPARGECCRRRESSEQRAADLSARSRSATCSFSHPVVYLWRARAAQTGRKHWTCVITLKERGSRRKRRRGTGVEALPTQGNLLWEENSP